VIPVQDVVPTGRMPAATLALIALNVLFFAASAVPAPVVPPFAHDGVASLIVALVFLWLFGDNVEARLGRAAFVALYLIGGWLPGLGGAGGVTAALGSYFVMLPQARVLMLVPLPSVLIEVPAVSFLAVWSVLHALRSIAAPRTLWMFVAAFVIGAGVARVMRPRVQW
jgi:membrane associated rhomboid family serine protease